MLCTIFAQDDGGETFVAWQLSAFETAEVYFDGDPARPSPDLRTVKGLGIGATWDDVLNLYPKATFSHGEGGSYGYEIGWPENCDGAICGNGRLDMGTALRPRNADPLPGPTEPATVELGVGIGNRDVRLAVRA